MDDLLFHGMENGEWKYLGRDNMLSKIKTPDEMIERFDTVIDIIKEYLKFSLEMGKEEYITFSDNRKRNPEKFN